MQTDLCFDQFDVSICLEAASIVLFKFAVSQLTRRLTEFLISRTIRTSSNRSIELVAPISVKKSAIFSAPFK